MADLPISESHEEQHPEDEQSVSSPKRKSGLHWVWKLGIFFVLLLAVIQLIFRFYSDEIIGRVLKEIVALKSNRLYHIDYDDISFDLFGQKLEIDNFRLIPNRARYYNEAEQAWTTKNSVFEARIPHIKLTGASVIDLYINNILSIDEFRIVEPNLTAYLAEKDSTAVKERLKINDLHFLIADRLDYFSIKDLKVDKASVSLVTKKDKEETNYLFQNVSLAAINFLIDSASQQKDQRPFSVEDISLKARYNLIKLPNSPYFLQFEDLELSTYAALFTVKGLRLTTNKATQQGRGKYGKRNLADIYIPYMRGTGVDYRGIYFNKKILINQLSLKQPEAVISVKSGRNRDRIASAEKLYRSISKQFFSIEVKKILLDNAYFEYQKDHKSLFFAERTSGKLNGFLLDSVSYRKRSEFFYLDDAELHVEDCEFPIDRIHQLTANSLDISTLTNRVTVKDLNLNCPFSPDELMKVDTSGNIQGIDLRIPLIRLDSFAIKKAYIDRKVQVNNFFVYQPNFSMFRYVADSIPDNTSDSLTRIQDLYPYVQNAFKSVYIRNFYLKEGVGSITRRFGTRNGAMVIDTASVTLRNVQLDPYSKFRKNTFLNTRNIEIDLAGLHFIRPDSLYQLDIGSVKTAQKDSSFQINDFHMRALLDSVDFTNDSLKLPPSFLNVAFRELRVDSLDVTKAYYSGELDIDVLSLKQPAIKIFKHPSFEKEDVSITPHEKLQEFISKNIRSLSLNHIEVDSGYFALMADPQFKQPKMALDSFGVYASDLLIDSSTLLYPEVLFLVDTFQFSGTDYHLNLPDSIHQLTIQHLGLSSDQATAFAENIQLKADSSKFTPTCHRYFAQLPEVRLKGFDPKLLYYDRIIEADSLLIPSPVIQADLWQKTTSASTSKTPFQLNKLFQLIAPSLNGIEIKATRLDSGFVQLSQLGQGKGQSYQAEKLQISLQNFILNEQAQPTADRLFYADNLSMTAQNVYHFLPDSTYTLHFGTLGFDAKKGNLWGLQINLHPLNQSLSENYLNAYIPEVQLEEIDLFRWYQAQGIAMKNLSISAPWLKAVSFPKAQTKDFSFDDLYEKIAPHAPSFTVESIQLEKGDFYLDRYEGMKPKEYHLGKLDLNVKRFHVDSLSSMKKKLFLSDAVRFSLKNYDIILPDSLHRLAFKELRINTQTSNIYVDSLQFQPLYPKYEYAQQLGFETDRIDFSINKGLIRNVDLRKLLDGSAIDAQKVIVNGFQVTAFRNKTAGLPQPENHHPKLPREALTSLSIPVDIDTISIRNSLVIYQEHNSEGDTMGYLTLNDMTVDIHNITNDPIRIKNGASIDMSTGFKIMNRGQVNIFVDLPIGSENGEFYMEGIIDTMSLDCLNPLLEPAASLQVAQGRTRQSRFKMRGNNTFSTGVIRFKYKGLRVNVLKKNHRRNILTILANAFVVIRNNPRRLIVRKGRIYFKRDTTRSFINYWANSVLTGVKDNIGLKNKQKPDKETRKVILNQLIERLKLEGLAERKEERERKKKLRKQLKKQRKEAARQEDKEAEELEKAAEEKPIEEKNTE